MTARRDIRRLVKLCADSDTAHAWLEALREVRDEIAIANHGERLTIEVVMAPHGRVRFGITSTGRIIFPLGGNLPADLRVEGDAEDVAAFLLGHLSLTDAIERGIVIVRPGLLASRLERLRAVVADKLREVLDGQTALVPVWMALSLRLRRVCEVPAELTAAAANFAPAVVATVALLAGPTPASATQPPVVTPAVTTISAVTVNAPGAEPLAAPAESAPTLAVPARPVQPRPPATSPPATVAISVGVGRNAPGLDGQERSVNVPMWGEFQCNSEFREAVCDAAETLPKSGT